MSKAQAIRNFLDKNPDATAPIIARAFAKQGVSRAYAANVRGKWMVDRARRDADAALTQAIAATPQPVVLPDNPMAVQVGGDHYTKLRIQPMEYSMKNQMDACQHTAIKYITRFRDKGGIADLEKAKHVIDMLIAFEKGEA